VSLADDVLAMAESASVASTTRSSIHVLRHRHGFSDPSGEVALVLGLGPRQSPPWLHAEHRRSAQP